MPKPTYIPAQTPPGPPITPPGLATLPDHNHTAPGDGGVLVSDQHTGYSEYSGDIFATTYKTKGKLKVPTPRAPDLPPAGRTRLYAVTESGHTQLNLLDQDGSTYNITRDSLLTIRNVSGALITKGSAVDIYAAVGLLPSVRLAISSEAHRHVEGLMIEDVADNATGLVMTAGLLQNVDTSAFGEGDVVWLSATVPGAITNVLQGVNPEQEVGIITRVGVNGAILVRINTDYQHPDVFTPTTKGLVPPSGGGAVNFLRADAAFATPPTLPHATSHQDGGTDEMNLTGLAGLLAQPQIPVPHATGHQNNGVDEINVAGLNGLLADPQTPLVHSITTGHTFPGGTTDFLRSDGVFAYPNYRRLVELGADVTIAAVTTFADITGLSFPVTADVNYRWFAMIAFTVTNPGQNGLAVSCVAPANPTHLVYSTAVGISTSGQTNVIWANAEYTQDSSTAPNISISTSGNLMTMWGFIRPSVTGVLQLRFAQRVATANGIVIKAGSTLEYW